MCHHLMTVFDEKTPIILFLSLSAYQQSPVFWLVKRKRVLRQLVYIISLGGILADLCANSSVFLLRKYGQTHFDLCVESQVSMNVNFYFSH